MGVLCDLCGLYHILPEGGRVHRWCLQTHPHGVLRARPHFHGEVVRVALGVQDYERHVCCLGVAPARLVAQLAASHGYQRSLSAGRGEYLPMRSRHSYWSDSDSALILLGDICSKSDCVALLFRLGK